MLCSAAKIIIIINNKNKAKDFCYFCCMCIPYNCWAFYIFFGILLSFSLFTFRGVVFQTWASLVAQTVKNPPAVRETWVGRCPGGGYGYSFQYSGLENPMDRGTWWAAVHGGHKESDPTE